MSAWIWVLTLGCAEPTSDPAGDGPTEVDACTVAVSGSGDPVGEASCTGGICEVPAGSFVMGDANPLSPDQCPPRLVELSAYGIDETEVTRAQYAHCVEAGPCDPVPFCESRAPGVVDPDQLPVVCLTHAQAETFCSWLGGRLPTEAEWEKAARGVEGALWAWGAHPPSCVIANFRYSSGFCADGVVDVGTYAAVDGPLPVDSTRSAYGLADTVGNAWEWTADAYDAGWYRDAPNIDPPGPEACATTVGADRGECLFKVIRGGAYNSVQDSTRGTTRSLARPGVWDVNLGMRCAYDR